MANKESIENFRRNVVDKYTIYNSLFAALPFSGVANVGNLLPIFLQHCVDGYEHGKSPVEIIDGFFAQQTHGLNSEEQLQRLFKFVQYIERQVVLFDAIEDAAFPSVNHVSGPGSMQNLLNEVSFSGKKEALKKKLEHFKIRIVLTAHPTQFYPGTVLGIIHDMAEAIGKNDFHTINQYIQQLGITPFFNKQKPTPYDEAVNLMWYMENIFYQSMGSIYNYIVNEIFDGQYEGDNSFVELGFWPGGDRDGNPFVDAATTLRVGSALRTITILCYYRDVRKLKRRLTFREVDKRIAALEQLLYENVFLQTTSLDLNKNYLLQQLKEIRELIVAEHHHLYLGMLDSLINKVKIFGTHFASLDIRQDSRIHTKVLLEICEVLKGKGEPAILPDNYTSQSDTEKIQLLGAIKGKLNPADFTGITKDTIESCYAIQQIQKANGEIGCHRYIISQCNDAVNVMELHALLQLCGFTSPMPVDIVPLFETIDDLKAAEGIMELLYASPVYMQHLQSRLRKQSIMLGFSDGTKDGGYLQANWSIYKAKECLTSISKKYEIDVAFFDGRGGPPARGGGKTHQFYASQGSSIENKEIQLTVQGQTITSNFGTTVSARYNVEQLLSAGLSNELFAEHKTDMNKGERAVMEELAGRSFDAYQQFKSNDLFMPYLQRMSPLKYYGDSNIASRPTKRNAAGALRFEDLRAIPFVGSWSQIKQNVPGYFGLGTAFQYFADKGRFDEVRALYQQAPFFRTLIDNSMMSMLKSFFPLTQFIDKDPEFGAFRRLIKDEYELTKKWVLVLSDSKELMEKDTISRKSINLRDKIVLPLLTIQQYAMQHLHEQELPADNKKAMYEKLITRSMFGIINAARNSA
ncbi:MAG: phosphoenolpyruvate carboxylase [Chitinophagaceae bacterium]